MATLIGPYGFGIRVATLIRSLQISIRVGTLFDFLEFNQGSYPSRFCYLRFEAIRVQTLMFWESTKHPPTGNGLKRPVRSLFDRFKSISESTSRIGISTTLTLATLDASLRSGRLP